MTMIYHSLDDFFSSIIGTVIEEKEQPETDYQAHERHRSIAIGQDIYTVSVRSYRDCEGVFYHEQWRKNDLLHRGGGYPAEILHHDHAIPEETYLDQSEKNFYLNGELQSTEDNTYEDIIRHKPLTVQQAFGYGIHEP